MANTKSTQHEIDLTSALNLNKFKADIKPYEGFNERNAPYYGGCLSPLFIKDDGIQSNETVFHNGSTYSASNNTFYKNNQPIMTFDSKGFQKLYPDFSNRNVKDFVQYDDNLRVYIYVNGSNIIINIGEKEVHIPSPDYRKSYIYRSGNDIYVAVIAGNQLYMKKLSTTGTQLNSRNRGVENIGLYENNYLCINQYGIQCNTQLFALSDFVEINYEIYESRAAKPIFICSSNGSTTSSGLNFAMAAAMSKDGFVIPTLTSDEHIFAYACTFLYGVCTLYAADKFEVQNNHLYRWYTSLKDNPNLSTHIFYHNSGKDMLPQIGNSTFMPYLQQVINGSFGSTDIGSNTYGNYGAIGAFLGDSNCHFQSKTTLVKVPVQAKNTYTLRATPTIQTFEPSYDTTNTGKIRRGQMNITWTLTKESGNYTPEKDIKFSWIYAVPKVDGNLPGGWDGPYPGVITLPAGETTASWTSMGNSWSIAGNNELKSDFNVTTNGPYAVIANTLEIESEEILDYTTSEEVGPWESPTYPVWVILQYQPDPHAPVENYKGYDNIIFAGVQDFGNIEIDFDEVAEYKDQLVSSSGLVCWSLDRNNKVCSPGGLFVNFKNHWRILGSNDGFVQGISYTNNTDSIGTLLTAWGSIGVDQNIYVNENSICYYDNDENRWAVIKTTDDVHPRIKIIGDYAVINTVSYANSINLKDNSINHWASDWNNRLNYEYGSGMNIFSSTASPTAHPGEYFVTGKHAWVGSAQNTNYIKNVLSSYTAPEINNYYTNAELNIASLASNSIGGAVSNDIEVFVDHEYYKSINNTGGVYNDSSLSGQIWPGLVRYNIPLLFDVVNSPYDLTIVKFGGTSFLVTYLYSEIRYQYYANSILNFDELFIIQGQAYGIARNKIYFITYANNTAQAQQPITTVEGLQFLGATIYNAYFYSPTSRAIYIFGADNNLQVFTQADTIAEVTGTVYIPSTGSLIIGVNEVRGDDSSGYTYILNERFGIFRVNEIKGLVNGSKLNDSSVACLTRSNQLFRISYEEIENFTKKNVVLDTSFYGAGSNVVSINDCWYIRVTDTEHNKGEVKLAVSTLTDIGRQTETRIKTIKKEDWDDLTDTVYIRFQPKLQRGVGVSLHIESPFKIGYIGVGATPETLQLSKGTI